MFRDRRDAGDQLLALLRKLEQGADVVLAVPRGGLPVAAEVAEGLQLPLDVVVSRRIAGPGDPHLALGAVAADGSTAWNDHALHSLGLDPPRVATLRNLALEGARAQERSLRRGRSPLRVLGKRVLLVDDGILTGATVRACLRALSDQEAASVTVAVPVGDRQVLRDLQRAGVDVVSVEMPWDLTTLEDRYQRFENVDADEIPRRPHAAHPP